MFPERENAEKRFVDRGRAVGFPSIRGLAPRVLFLALACFYLPFASVVAQAETAEEKGLRIAREASARNEGFGDFTAGMTMVLRDRHGRESVRRMRFKVLEVK